MTTRSNLVTIIKSDFIEKMTLANGYTVEPIQVVIGVPSIESITQYPTLCFFLMNDPLMNENLDDDRERQATFVCIGYTNNSESIYEFSEQVEKFLYDITNFTFANLTMFDLDGPTFSVGGVTTQKDLAMFDFQFTINYTQDFS